MINKIIENARINPDKIAYVDNGLTLTYKELVAEAFKLSKKLKTYKTNNIIIYGHKELFVPITILACLMSNKTYIPIDYYIPINRINKIVNSLKDFLIVSNSKLPELETYSIDSLIEKEEVIDSNNDISYIIFTSGSTGEPKGVPISFNNLSNFTKWISNTNPFNEYKDAIVFNQASFSFDLSVAGFYYALYNNHTIVEYDNSLDSPDYIYELLKNNKVNVMVVTPTFMRYVVLNKEFNENNYKDLKCLYFCGEKLHKDLVNKIYKRFKDIKIVNAYGPTEATSAVSAYLIKQNELDKYIDIPVGDMKNLATKVEIINDEIVLSGESVFKGYLNSEIKITKYHTGDIGEIKDDLLFCKGRIDNQIKYKGYRIELEEIESVLNKLEYVNESLVVPIQNDEEVLYLCAYVVLNINVTVDKIKEELKDVLPEYMVPSEIVIKDKLKVSNNGKLIREVMEDD